MAPRQHIQTEPEEVRELIPGTEIPRKARTEFDLIESAFSRLPYEHFHKSRFCTVVRLEA